MGFASNEGFDRDRAGAVQGTVLWVQRLRRLDRRSKVVPAVVGATSDGADDEVSEVRIAKTRHRRVSQASKHRSCRHSWLKIGSAEALFFFGQKLKQTLVGE